HPVHAAMAVIGAAVAVLAEGAAEFGEHHHGGVVPGVAQRVGVGGEAFAEVLQVVGEAALGAALVDVGVPAAHVDEAEAVLVAHQGGDATRLGGEVVRAGGAAAGRHHL